MWTLVFLFAATWHTNGYVTLAPPGQFVETDIKAFATRAEAEAALVERMKSYSQVSGLPTVLAIPAIAGPYTTSVWAGDALLVSPTGKVEKVRAKMGTRKVVKEVEVEEETGWTVEVTP